MRPFPTRQIPPSCLQNRQHNSVYDTGRGKDLVALLQALPSHHKHNGPGSPQAPLQTMPHACNDADFTYRSVTLETSASSSIPAIWFCSPPGAYKTAPFSKSWTSPSAAGCLSGGTSDPCHLSDLGRKSSGNDT